MPSIKGGFNRPLTRGQMGTTDTLVTRREYQEIPAGIRSPTGGETFTLMERTLFA
jgi:hypothetical protein